MAKWVYERWTIKWDDTKFTYVVASPPRGYSTRPIEIATLEFGDSGLVEGKLYTYREDEFYPGMSPTNHFYLRSSAAQNNWFRSEESLDYEGISQSRIKDERLEDIVLEEGTVPDDGIHTDGYWYVKVKPAFPTMRILRDGQWAEVETGYVLKDGVWKPIEEIYKLQDGQWVQA